MAITLVGIVLLIAGGVFLFLRQSAMNRLATLMGTETYTAKALQELCSSIGGEIGKGSFKQMSEVKGKVVCDAPLESELAKQSCVYYRTVVEREYEETYYEEDPETHNKERKTRRGSETISSNTRSTDFFVQDETGKIKVHPEKADIDLVKAMDKFESASSVNLGGGQIRWGNFSFALSSGINLGGEGRRTLGYHFREYIFPLDQRVFVLGEASDSRGELMLAKPSEKKGQFIISTKSEEELTAGAKKNIQTFKIVSIICFAAGGILTVAGFFVR